MTLRPRSTLNFADLHSVVGSMAANMPASGTQPKVGRSARAGPHLGHDLKQGSASAALFLRLPMPQATSRARRISPRLEGSPCYSIKDQPRSRDILHRDAHRLEHGRLRSFWHL